MSFLLGVAIFVVALLGSIMLHEAGHFATAKWFGMKATQFFVGFGRTIWSRQKGETEYGVKAIPAGGFVKIVGMTDLEEVDPADEPRSFRRQPGWQRIIVLAAGSFMHFVLAFVLLFIVAAGIGLETGSAGTTVGAVESCVPANVNLGCAKSDPKSPASEAGVRVGDKIVSIAGIRVTSWTQMGKAIRAQHTGSAVPVVVDRRGQLITLHAKLASLTGHGAYLGVSPLAVFQRVGPTGAV
jgi:membrane-associated protease RseP (regulator of RpoE activity)